jgi:hypothetical protein
MPKSKATAQHDQRIIEKESERDAARQRTESFAEIGREQKEQTATGQKAALNGTLRTGSALANGAQEIMAIWARYAEDLMRNTSAASQALLRARNFAETLEVQAHMLRNNLQAFLEQSARVAELASRMTTRSFEASRQTPQEQSPLASEYPRNTPLIKLLDPS